MRVDRTKWLNLLGEILLIRPAVSKPSDMLTVLVLAANHDRALDQPVHLGFALGLPPPPARGRLAALRAAGARVQGLTQQHVTV